MDQSGSPPRPPWRTTLGDMHAGVHARVADDLFRLAIEPACAAVATELAACNPTDDKDPEWDRRDDLRRAQLEMHRSFTMMLGGLWERNFQRLLADAAFLLAEPEQAGIREKIKAGSWNGLAAAFLAIRGFSLADFPVHAELELLHRVTSAVRHGDGPSADKVRELAPDMFLATAEPMNWFTYFTRGADGDSAVNRLEVTFERLTAFKDAVAGFWLEIDEMRRNGV